MALPRITQKEMTNAASSVNLKHCWIWLLHCRVLTKLLETESIKKEYIDKLMVEREAEAKPAS